MNNYLNETIVFARANEELNFYALLGLRKMMFFPRALPDFASKIRGIPRPGLAADLRGFTRVDTIKYIRNDLK